MSNQYNDKLIEIWQSEYDELIKAKQELEVLHEKNTPKSWIKVSIGGDYEHFQCPCCKEAYYICEGNVNDNDYHYCPNCGQALQYKDDEPTNEEDEEDNLKKKAGEEE